MAEEKRENQAGASSQFKIEDFPAKKDFGKITQESFYSLRDRIGVERARPLEDWEIEDMKITRSLIRRAALAIGDYNPLYRDLEYAKKSPLRSCSTLSRSTPGPTACPGCTRYFVG